ncbi:MAG: DNA protecting protein DprA [Candidatus Yanofskybacteria bacterium RIFCSPHIGHO2_01_FULL_41_21]|uniref:DNA protecting protein DprA n=1 Tax=Candidatus Yanofskybacteria bacterium RIFCSPHIGHO2_01_FULL_41_21 TaxID=1802660 RepID=A0A1F8EBZ5_9BACT|nr:MAG: DNA protecting protein DprA [Candidatus Yanofskybacteria bacterium RIFCSPHIGHO2_01_FULL_41_21]
MTEYPIVELHPKLKAYPKLLRHITDPPAMLYCRGNISLLNTECFAVVGTRSMTPYGREATQQIVPGLARHFTIVSGLALGIDAVAHRATLDCGGKTIAVLGSGINLITPETNLRLGQDILKNDGLIVSEHPGKNPAYKDSFPERNRIISGLSKGVLVVEADEKSGSLITARLAGEQNRDVFSVPGNIFSSKSMGPHKLIRTGAKLVASSHDILDDYSKLPLAKSPHLSTIDPTHAMILAILEAHGPLNIDSIIEYADLGASEIIGALALMEIQGHIKQMAGGIFRKSN